MKHYKLVAGVMTAVMVLGNSLVALADSGSTTGQGDLDIAQESAIFSVVLPTVPEDSSPFDYIVDPEGVIKITDAAKYDGATFEEGQTVYFANTSGTTDYSHVSDTLVATNKSTMDVTITVEATVAEADGIELVTKNSLAAATTASLYLGFSDSVGNQTPTALTTAGLTASANIAAAEGAYTISYNAAEGCYEKVLDEDFAGTFETYSFKLEGACSTKGWDSSLELPAVDVVWSIENPAYSGPIVSITTDGKITISRLTAEQNYAKSAVLSVEGKGSFNLDTDKNVKWDVTGYSATEGGTLSFIMNSSWMSYVAGQKATITVTLSDGSVISASCQF